MSTMEDSDSDLPIMPVAEEKIRTFEDVPGPNGRPMARIDGNIYYIEKFTKTTIYYKCINTKLGCRARAIMKSSRGTHRIELKHFHEYHEDEDEPEAPPFDETEDGEGDYADGNEGEYDEQNDQSDWNYQENENPVEDEDINSEFDGKTGNSSPWSSSAVEQSPHAPGSDIDSEMCVDIDPSNFLDQSTMEDDEDEDPPELEGPYVHTHNTRKRRRSNYAQLNGKSSKLSVQDQDLDESETAEPDIGENAGNLYQFNHEVHILDESGKLMYQCGLCETTFQLLSVLRKHLIVVHQIEQSFKCSKCTKSFARPDLLKKHEKDEHQGTSKDTGDNKGEFRFKCPHCVKTFGHESSVKSHVMLHFGIKPFRCTYDGCDKAYSQKTHLTQHLMVHSGERPYSCRVCDEAFRISSHCRQHEMRKHQLYEPRPRTGRNGQNGQSSPE